MEKKRYIPLIIALVLFATAMAKKQPEKSNTREARCLVKVTADPAAVPANLDSLVVIIQSPKVMNKAAIDVLGLPHEQAVKDYEIKGLFESEAETHVELHFVLSEEAKPAAGEFISALVNNLREVLTDAYEKNHLQLRTELEKAQNARDKAQVRLSYILEQAPKIKQIDEQMQGPADSQKLETVVHDIPGLMPASEDLITLIQETVEPESWYDAGGEGTISIYQGRKLVVRQTKQIHQKIAKLLEEIKPEIPVDVRLDVPTEMLNKRRDSLFNGKQEIEMDTARLHARRKAIEEQIMLIKEQSEREIAADAVTKELSKLIEMHAKQLEEISGNKDKPAQAKTEPAEGNERIELISEKLTRARIELAERQEYIRRISGGDQLAKFNNQLSELMVELAEKEAILGVIGNQLNEIQGKLMSANTLDPRIQETTAAMKAVKLAESRVEELSYRLSNLRPPIVTVIGADNPE